MREALDAIPRRLSRSHAERRDRRRGSRVSPPSKPRWATEPDEALFGLYQGTPLTERSWAHGNALPDRITLFQRTHRGGLRQRGRGVRGSVPDADPRGRPLLRIVRGRDSRPRRSGGSSRDSVANRRRRRESAEAVRPAFSRAGLGGEGRCRDRSRSRTRRFSKSAPAGARSPAARGPGRPPSWPSRSIAISPPISGGEQMPRVEIVEGDILTVDLEALALPHGNARRRQSALQHLVADPRAARSDAISEPPVAA